MFEKKIIWEKLGLIIKPQKKLWFQKTHSMVPTPEYLSSNKVRILFSGRNKLNQSIISFAVLEFNKNKINVIYHKKPLLTLGRLGTFDDNGVTPSCVINIDKNTKALYYIGWNPGSTTRMNLYGGLALFQKKSNKYIRWSESPILERTKNDPMINTAPWVLKINKNLFYMYYVSGLKWQSKDLPYYNIKMAISKDGFNWIRDGKICIDFKNRFECALARPYVIFDNNLYRMWFSYRSIKTSYRIGYAESVDGVNWIRNDKANVLKKSKNSFDSEMIAYAVVVKIKDIYYMLYNGNNYGYDGIGIAKGIV